MREEVHKHKDFGSSLIQVNQLYIDKLIIDRQFRSISLMMSYAMA